MSITIWSIFSGICRAIGLFKWAEHFWENHEAKVHAQAIADIPLTDKEWETNAKKGKL